ncbi:hypothetical protein RJ641_027971 [Dillenia turbinata]|uniref:Uncharacterized protein n=1 Tax=Dillenia turbinata TaxID=194707 RepID=A0AAN8VYF1_9MAGN
MVASPKGSDAVPEASDHSFPPADAGAELNSGQHENFAVDPISADVAPFKEEAKVAKKTKEQQKKDAMHTLKSAIIISGIVAALAGAVFAITKKLKEK